MQFYDPDEAVDGGYFQDLAIVGDHRSGFKLVADRFTFCSQDLQFFFLQRRPGAGKGAQTPDEVMDRLGRLPEIDLAGLVKNLRRLTGCLMVLLLKLLIPALVHPDSF